MCLAPLIPRYGVRGTSITNRPQINAASRAHYLSLDGRRLFGGVQDLASMRGRCDTRQARWSGLLCSRHLHTIESERERNPSFE